jgi:hypothetical protein
MTMAATNRDTTIRHARRGALTEQARWILTLGAPYVVAATFVMATVSTGITWLFALAIAAGPGAGVIGLVFLALNSDTNAAAAAGTSQAASATETSPVVAEAA